MTDPTLPAAPTVTVDDREPRPGLADEIAALWSPVLVGRLCAGDVEIGARIGIERKTPADFVASLRDGRLFRQAGALAVAYQRPLLVVEGDDALAFADLTPRQLRGVIATLLVGYRIPLLRTSNTAETAQWVVHIAVRERRRIMHAPVPSAPRPARVAMDMLGAIPGVGDAKARRLVERFGSAERVLTAPAEKLRQVDGVGARTARAIREAATSDIDGVPIDRSR